MQRAGAVNWLDDDDDGTLPYVLRSGETVAAPAFLVRTFAMIDEQRAQERLDYCQRHGYDPDTFTGCYACEGTGRHLQTNDHCWCDYGAELERRAADREEADFWARVARNQNRENG